MARFVIKSSDIERIGSQLDTSLEKFDDDIEACKTAINELIQLDSSKFSGQAADSIRAYMEEVHLVMLKSAQQISSAFLSEFKLYANKYAAIEGAADFCLPDSEMEEFREDLGKEPAQLEAICEEANSAMRSVSDLVPYSEVTPDSMIDVIESMRTGVAELQDDIIEIEEETSARLDKLEEAIAGFEKCVALIGAEGWTGPDNYQKGDFLKSSAYKELSAALYYLHEQGEITDSYRENYVSVYEENHPDQAKILDAYLEKLSEYDKMRIKYIVYTADEPYKTLFLQGLGTWGYKLGDLDVDGVYNSIFNTVNLDISIEDDNDRGDYTTFFHENGHAIDFNCDGYNIFNGYSNRYRNAEGKSLQEVLYDDVLKDIKETIDNATENPAQRWRLFQYIKGHNETSMSWEYFSEEDKKLLNKIKKYYMEQLDGAVNEAGSDVYGGVTNNIITGQYGHGDAFYWYDVFGFETGSQARELWAEFFSYKITDNKEALKSIEDHFPDAYQFMEEMAESMLKGG